MSAHTRRRRNPRAHYPAQPQMGGAAGPLIILVVGGAAAALAYFLTRKDANATGLLGTGYTPVTTPGLPGTTTPPASTDPCASGKPVAVCLAANPTARKIYAFQAAMYAWNLTEEVPDGKWGSHTSSMAQRIYRAAGIPSTSAASYSDQILRNAPSGILVLRGQSTSKSLADVSHRLVPAVMAPGMTQAIINQVNTAALSVNGGFPLLQLNPTA